MSGHAGCFLQNMKHAAEHIQVKRLISENRKPTDDLCLFVALVKNDICSVCTCTFSINYRVARGPRSLLPANVLHLIN